MADHQPSTPPDHLNPPVHLDDPVNDSQNWFKRIWRWMKNNPYHVFGRILALIYAAIIGFKVTHAHHVAALISHDYFYYIMGSLSLVATAVIFWAVVPFLLIKLRKESLLDATIQVIDENGHEETVRIKFKEHFVKMGWGSRIVLGFLTLCILSAAIAVTAIAVNSIIPTLVGVGFTSVGQLALSHTILMLAPIAAVVMFCYTALNIRDAAVLLARQDLKQYAMAKIKHALALDAKTKYPGDPKAQSSYKKRQFVTAVLFMTFMALALIATYSTFSMGIELFTHAFPQAIVGMQLAASHPQIAFLNPYLTSFAIVGVTPFLSITLYKFSHSLIHYVQHVQDTYVKHYATKHSVPYATWKTGVELTKGCLTSIKLWLMLIGVANAANQGVVASSKYGNLSEGSVDKQVYMGCNVAGPMPKYTAMTYKALGEKPSAALTKIMTVERQTYTSAPATYLFNVLDPNKTENLACPHLKPKDEFQLKKLVKNL